MATIPSTGAERRFVLHDVSWQAYEALLAGVGDRGVRIAFDRGTLEMMSPSAEHERYKHRLNRMVLIITEELNQPLQGLGSTTWRKEQLLRGVESDECYYLQSESLVRGKEEIDLDVDPPPDLAIEIEISRSAIDRLVIYAALGVREVWRFDGQALLVLLLDSQGAYVEHERSEAFPMFSLTELARFLRQDFAGDETSWRRTFRQWVRDILDGTGHSASRLQP